MGFLVNKSLKVISTNLVNERIATMTVTKKIQFQIWKNTNWSQNFQKWKNIGITSSQQKSFLTDDFHHDLQKTMRGLHSVDLIVVEDFKAKVGKKSHKI